MDAHTLDLTLPSEAESVAEARTRVCAAIAPEFGANEVERLKLLVSELVTNAVLHARTAVRVRAWAEVGRVTVAVGDDDPLHGPRWTDGGPMATSGRGMRLVDLLASSWGIEVRETTKFVWFESAYEPELADLGAR
jgi:anti-sigma regulatory factor (Ser/Thr protein kinase)